MDRRREPTSRRLVIGNRCYSSWSLRPWLLMKTLRIPFEEVFVPLERPESEAYIRSVSPSGLVPVLLDGDTVVWESLSILEHLAESTPKEVWPAERSARAAARSLAAEMHAGFPELRRAYPMNLGKRYAWKERPEAARDVARIFQIIEETRTTYGQEAGDFLFGPFGAVDAMYAPVIARFETYSVPLDGAVAAYRDAVTALPAYQEWREKALQEPWILPGDEVDDEPIEDLRRGIATAIDPSDAAWRHTVT